MKRILSLACVHQFFIQKHKKSELFASVRNVNDSLFVCSSHKASSPLSDFEPRCSKEQHKIRRWRQGRRWRRFIWPVGTRLCSRAGRFPVPHHLYVLVLWPLYFLSDICWHCFLVLVAFVLPKGWEQECIWWKSPDNLFAIWQLWVISSLFFAFKLTVSSCFEMFPDTNIRMCRSDRFCRPSWPLTLLLASRLS